MLAGFSLLELTALYNRCGSDHFMLCYTVTVGGYMQKMLSAMLSLSTVLTSTQLFGLRDDDKAPHKALVRATLICYLVGYVASSICIPIDDHLFALTDDINLTTVTTGNPDTVQGNNYDIGLHWMEGDMWHAFNVIRLVAAIAGWCFTALDMIYQYRCQWTRDLESGQANASLRTTAPQGTLGQQPDVARLIQLGYLEA
eukprot:TRINITY_DN17738_c0_g1_i1.p1 TRINITY_DN17738_c0_g1~~TRINITY_DN17738_c0_g1_i1.p1  ORF type:complete len:199 (+),score=33.70 TRINITY_DN17738_c0_g1_i1:237-833(+)